MPLFLELRSRSRFLILAAVAFTSGCTSPPAETPQAVPRPTPAQEAAVDDGTYLKRIDPLGGQWLVERIGEAVFTSFKAWINSARAASLSTGQAAAAAISRSSVYYLPKPVSAADLAIMRRIDELHLEFPFAGSRMLRDLLRQEGTRIGRQHVATLMKKMAIEAIYRRPNTSKPAPGHKIYPYLLRKLAIVRPNQVWATDINRHAFHR